MTPTFQPQLFAAGLVGLSAGVAVFVRGLAGYRQAAALASIATSSADALAAGEVRLSGTIEPLEQTLVSPLQSLPCVWYDSTITDGSREHTTLLHEQRAVEFLVRDATGTVRVMPRGARWEAPLALDVTGGFFGGAPDEVRLRLGPASTAIPELDHDAAVAELLTVHAPVAEPGLGATSLLHPTAGSGALHYREARLEPGQQVTIVGYAVPWGELDEALAGDSDGAFEDGAQDAAIASDLEAARAAGLLADNAADAWGNAAIPGFGIGKPVTPPHLETGATPLPVAPQPQAERARRLFDIPPETLVVASGPSTPLTICLGVPAEATARDRWIYYRGLAGAGLAVVSAVALAAMLNGGL